MCTAGLVTVCAHNQSQKIENIFNIQVFLSDFFIPKENIFLKDDIDRKEFPQIFIKDTIHKIVQEGLHSIESLLFGMLIYDEGQGIISDTAFIAMSDVISSDTYVMSIQRGQGIRNEIAGRNHHRNTFYQRILRYEFFYFQYVLLRIIGCIIRFVEHSGRVDGRIIFSE